MSDQNQNPLHRALSDGRTLLGFSSTLAAEGVGEAIAGLGFDYLWIDAQHGHHTVATAREAVREAQQAGLFAAIRVPGHEYGSIGPFLDTGAECIIVPMVSTTSEAASIVRATRFSPRGARSFGGRRVCDRFGFNYHRTNEPVVIAQIESAEGYRHADGIIALDGIDMLLLGSVDLAIDMGLPQSQWRISSPPMEKILRELVTIASRHRKWVGCVAPGPDAFAAAIRCGSRFISAGDDTVFLRDGLTAWLHQVRATQEEGTQ
jgi:2-keto-3-deoxy-L-rhamnonate aldolase RhmA